MSNDHNSSNNNNYASSSDDDEQMARDLQLAYDLQEKEERRVTRQQKKKASKNNKSPQHELLEDGFVLGQLNADYMLFVTCEIDGRLVEMLIDSGAGASAMTTDMVRQLGLQAKLNDGIVGNCAGVGSANIVGVVENVACLIGQIEFRLFFMVLDSSLPSVVLGLDQMRRFQCIIDLEDQVLKFGGKQGIAVPFLPPELAKQAAARLSYASSSASEQQYTASSAAGAAAPTGGLNYNGGLSWARNLFGGQQNAKK